MLDATWEHEVTLCFNDINFDWLLHVVVTVMLIRPSVFLFLFQTQIKYLLSWLHQKLVLVSRFDVGSGFAILLFLMEFDQGI
ncbi:hypothetical protein VNO77_05443 [Canavalia gladiata]|uniref:Uncharacterized protein n=1 Tax=Canavalia gladiata TaxID=3824 RepID=A0AAN9N3K4_CANGL